MFRYRDAIRDDFAVIATFPRNRREAYYMYPRGNYPLTAEQLYEAAQQRTCCTVVLDAEGNIAAYANIYKWVEGEECWIGNVIVRPEYRGKGAGRFLIEVMKKRAREELNVNTMKLICHNTNTRALLFYAKLGFIPFEVRKQVDYDNHEIAQICMKTDLVS